MLQKYWQKKASGKKGFTLIEMIVVIAILIILMALMVPLLSKYLKQATDATKQSNARAVYTAAAAWAADEISQKGQVGTGTGYVSVAEDELKEYFNGSGDKKLAATVDASTGAVVWAAYDDQSYPPNATNPNK